MALITQQPDALSLTGNMKDVKILSSVKVRFTLKKGVAVLIDEEYMPNLSSTIVIDIKDVVASSLSLAIPTTDVYAQLNIAADYSIHIDGSALATCSFRAVRCGIENLSDSAVNFLTANWLTWQQQTKQVTADQPEWLTYYFTQAGTVKARFYNKDGTNKVVILGAGAAGDCKSFNTQWTYLWPLGETVGVERYGYIDVWVEDEGVTLSYTQRYIYKQLAALDRIYLCQNSLGGIDTFLFSGEMRFEPENEHVIASLDEGLLSASNNHLRRWTQNTGALACKNIWELFRSLQAYYLKNGEITKIVLEESSIEESNIDNIKTASFTYRISADTGYLNIVRSDSLPTNLQVVAPDSELFFLAPRLVEFPEANPSDSLLVPVQSPLLQAWKKISLGAIKNWILGLISTSETGVQAHTHDNKDVLDELSEDAENNLQFRGRSIASGDKFLRKDIEDIAAGKITFGSGLLAKSSGGDGMDDGVVEDTNLDEATANLGITEETPFGETLGSLSNVNNTVDFSNDSLSQKILIKEAGSDNWTEAEISSIIETTLFNNVTISGEDINIDFSATPYAKVTLRGTPTVFNLNINNATEGSNGLILVFQTGFKQINLNENITGSIDMPLNDNTIVLLSYRVVSGVIYLHSNIVVGDVQYPSPQRIINFQSTYYDSAVCSVIWSAPWANNIYDSATSYDVRYANSQVNADDPQVWTAMKRINMLIAPAEPGTLESYTISGLVQNTEYYIYIKAVKINYGVAYTSPASDPVYFKTKGYNIENTTYYRLNIDARNLYPRRSKVAMVDGVQMLPEKAFDEQQNEVFTQDGRPELSNINFNSFYKVNTASSVDTPYYCDIDLHSKCVLDRLYILTESRLSARVFIASDLGYEYELVAESSDTAFAGWENINLQGKEARFIRIAYDKMKLNCGNAAEGTEVYIERYTAQYNPVSGIRKIFLYGRELSAKPLSILPPMRSAIAPRTIDEFFCTNGHFYQPGRIHSLCSGSRVRLYGSSGWFMADSAKKGTEINTIAGFTVNPGNFIWYNWGFGLYGSLYELLRDTYAKYNLKPFLSWTGMSVQWFGYDPDNANQRDNKPLDNYWLPGSWKPLPKVGVRGYEEYFAETKDPANYKTYAKMVRILAAIYGSNANIPLSSLDLESGGVTAGMDLLTGIEIDNEPDGTWNSYLRYYQPEEYVAELSAAADGHCGTLLDENSETIGGMKSADPNFTVVSPGFAGFHIGYFHMMYQWAKAHRNDSKYPGDVINYHTYFSINGASNQDVSSASGDVNYSVPGDMLTYWEEQKKINEYRCRFFPDKEIWVTEFGHGEAGGIGKACANQAFSLAGKRIGSWLIPDRHRSEVKGSYIIRDCVMYLANGVNLVNYFSTECSGDYFGTGQWNSGAGYEMWEWDRMTDNTPGAKFEAIKPYMVNQNRTGFATTGLFGEMTSDGCYPITKAFWYVATFRNRLRGYVFTGLRHSDADSRIIIACFRKLNEDKGAYIVYLKDIQNDGVPNVPIALPQDATYCKRVETYTPLIPDPRVVPNNIGNDALRTGLPTTRYEKYVQGQWVIQNKKTNWVDYESFAQGPASYPENPQEGDEVRVLPTATENPYFPIVGSIAGRYSSNGISLYPGQYEKLGENNIWEKDYLPYLALRQVNAVCDFIEDTEEGQRGTAGIETEMTISDSAIVDNVSEFPIYYFFDAVPDPDFDSVISDLFAITLTSSSVKLLWNNNNAKDTHYEIFKSEMPDSGFSILTTIAAGVENATVITGLTPNTSYYFKIRPLCESKQGILSESVGVTTPRYMDAPSNVRLGSRTATTITLAFDYATIQQPDDFLAFGVYRSTGSGFSLVGRVEDFATRSFVDTGLTSGTSYSYKIRAIGASSNSDYSSEFATRTALLSESSPTPQSATTDKLGSKIIILFDIDLGTVSPGANSDFIITEDNNVRVSTMVYIDPTDTKKMVITMPSEQFSSFESNKAIHVQYTNNHNIESVHGIELNSFASMDVNNMIGNFTNLLATYKINLTVATDQIPVAQGWNNLIGHPSTAPSIVLLDIYGRDSGKSVGPYIGGIYAWGGGLNGGQCSIEGIETAIVASSWSVSFGATISENKVARLQFVGMNDTRLYTVKGYGGTSSTTAERLAKLKVGDKYSPAVNQSGNTADMMIVEDITSNNGILNVDFIHATTDAKSTNYPRLNFLIVEEYATSTDAANQDVFIREVVITELDNGVIRSENINIRFNCIGTPTEYRIGKLQDVADGSWVAIGSNNTAIYSLSAEAYGSKDLYFQVKNPVGVSNVKKVSFDYQDPYVPLSLNGVSINNDDSITFNNVVSVTPIYDGTPTHFKISESPSFSGVEWAAIGTVPMQFTLSGNSGLKTVYVKLKDSLSESATKSDSIQYIILEYVTADLDVTLPSGVMPEDVIINVAPLKYNKRFIYGYTIDDGTMQAYSVVWNLINKKWIDDANFMHLGATPTANGFTPVKTLGYTDGFGVERRFAIANALMPIRSDDQYSPKRLESGTGAQQPYLILDELKLMMDFDCDFVHHNIDEGTFDKYSPASILRGFADIDQYMTQKVGCATIILAEPDGNTNYTTAALNYDGIHGILRAIGNGFTAINVLADGFLPGKIKVLRDFFNGISSLDAYKAKVDTLSAQSVLGTSAWWEEMASHRPRANVTDSNHGLSADTDWINRYGLLNYINDTYGKDGSDDVWFATMNEVVEYLTFKSLATITHSNNAGKLHIQVKWPKLPNFKWFETTLILSTTAGGLTTGGNVYGCTSGNVNGRFIINVNAMESLYERAVKYADKYIVSRLQNDLDDANYFKQRLKPSLQTVIDNRITDGLSAVPVESVALFETGTQVSSGNVTVGSSIQLTPQVRPLGASNRSVSYTSSDNTKATVDSFGVVVTIAIGTVIIRATSVSNPSVFGEFTLNINAAELPVTEVVISGMPNTGINQNLQLYATCLPEGSEQAVDWLSMNTEIATVDQNGLVAPLIAGEVTIRATSVSNPTISEDFLVTITNNATVAVTSVVVTGGQSSVSVDGLIQLTAECLPTTATNREVTWTSLDENKATVVAGLVTAIAAGSVIIRATSVSDPTVYGEYTLTINEAVGPVEHVPFEDAVVEAALVAASLQQGPTSATTLTPADANGDGVLTMGELASIKSLSNRADGMYSLFSHRYNNVNTQITHFNELQHFIGLTVPESIFFAGCTALSDITLPYNITSLPASAFYQTAIVRLVIPEGVTTIGERLLEKATAIAFIDIPSTITSIGGYMINQATTAPILICRALTPPTLAGALTYANPGLSAIYVPDASVAAYKAAANWSGKAAIIYPLSQYTS